MDTTVDFESKLFHPFLPEDSQVNPQIYGAELAFWLSRKLAEKGVFTSYPEFEDWGWFIEYITEDGDEYMLCCANRDGANDLWRCFLVPKSKGLFGRGKAKPENAVLLLKSLQVVLAAEQEIQNIKWSSEQ
jgi:hypothetical protein